MILKNKNAFYEESGFEKFQARLKTWIYIVMHELLQCQMCSAFIYKCLIIIETIQLLWYSIHPKMFFLWDTDFATYMREVIKYFQLQSLLDNGDGNFFIAVLYVIFSIQIIMAIILMFISWRVTRRKKTTSTFLTYSLKIFSLYDLLLNTIATMPLFNVFFAALYCSNSDPVHGDLTCYQGFYFVHLVIAIIGMIFLLFFLGMSTILYVELNPNLSIPFAAPQSRVGMLKLIIKIALPLYMVLDFNGNFIRYYVAILGIIWFIILVLRYSAAGYYDKSVNTLLIICESILFWTTAVSNIHAFLTFDVIQDLGLFYLFLLAPFIAYTYKKIVDSKNWNIIQTEIKSCKKDTEVESYVNLILDLIENRDKPEPRIKLEGLLRYHLKYCTKKEDQCNCNLVAVDNMKDDENPEKTKNWYMFVRYIISDGLERFPKSSKLHLLYAYVQHAKLKNRFKALFELMITEENKPNIQEEFSVYRYKNLIEEEMIENDMRNSESKGIDVNIIVHFQNKFVVFQSSLEKSVNLHLDFWRELLEESPDIQKLQGLGSKITNHVEITAEQFKKLNEMNPNQIKCLLIYGNFLRDIVNDEIEGQRILEKADYVDKTSNVNRQFIDNDRLKYGENSNTCILTCSCNFNSMGAVMNTNNEITRIFQFTKSDIIGQNINRIMPKIIADVHDGIMKRYMETSEPRIIGKERFLLPQNKAGYVVPCTLMVKVLPNLDDGIKMVGFLKDVDNGGTYGNSDFDSDEKVHYILYGGENGTVHGLTYSCYQSFGIPASLVYGNNSSSNEFTIDTIFPDFNNQNMEELKSPSGLILALDTTTLSQNYLIAENSDISVYKAEDDGADYEESVHQSKYKRVKVRAILIQEEDIMGLNLKTLKFVEVNDNEEMRKVKSISDAQGDNKQVNETQQQQQNDADQDGNKSIADSDHDSSVSAESVNESLRQLKDFKALISEKTVPKSIKILARTMWLLGAILITLISVALSLNFSKSDDINEGVYAVYEAYQRHNVMADINFNIRQLQLLATNMTNLTLLGVTNQTYELSTKSALATMIDNLQNIQFEVIKANIKMQSKMSNPPADAYYSISYLLQGNQTKSQQNLFNDALFQYITSASSIRNSSLGSFTSTSDVESTGKNFFFVRVNGLDPLRNGSETIANNFYNFYSDRTNFHSKNSLIIAIVAVVILIISQFILVPIVFSVHRTNNKVLSLFGYIPTAEINELAEKCEKYIANWLEERTEKRNYEYDKDEHEGEMEAMKSDNPDGNHYTEVHVDEPEGDENLQVSVADGMNTVENKMIQYQKDDQNKKVHPNIALTTSIMKNGNTLQVPIKSSAKQGMNQSVASNSEGTKPGPSMEKSSNLPQDKKDNRAQNQAEAEKKEEQEAELLNDRAQKLLNAKDNNRRNVIMQFSFVTLIFVLYFIADYIIQMVYMQQVRTSMSHLQLISTRSPNIKYAHTFNLEELALGMNYLTNQIDRETYYVNQVYSTEGAIKSSMQSSFPSSFNPYFTSLINYNLQDACMWYYNVSQQNYTGQASCKNVQSGLITKGLQTSIVAVIEQDRAVVSGYFQAASANTTANLQYNAINDPNFYSSTQILSFIIPAIQNLLDIYASNFNDFINYYLTLNKVHFSIMLVFIFFIFLFVWRPYLQNLSSKIWRTKGMLNMIPMEIISKNESLKNMFISGDLLQAVK